MSEIKVKVSKHGKRKYLIMFYDDPVTGKREQRSTKKTTRREAEREAAKWEAELRAGKYSKDQRITWQQFRQRYEDEKLTAVSEHAMHVTATALNHFERLVNPLYLRAVSSAVVSRFQADLRKEGKPDTTIACYLRHLKATLRWAAAQGLLPEAPRFNMPGIGKGRRMMRGRPITTEEFERMLAAVPKVRPLDSAAWVHYLTGLWLSGLRLEESTIVSWDSDAPFSVDLSGRRPMFRIYAEAQKARRDELLPMTPDFAAFILSTPIDQRHGELFKLIGLSTGRQLQCEAVGIIVSAIGETAGVVANGETGKHATAHDLRRSFASRWASKVRPAALQRLMRHADIQTTMRYYVALDADDIADELWEKHAEVGTSVGTWQNPLEQIAIGQAAESVVSDCEKVSSSEITLTELG